MSLRETLASAVKYSLTTAAVPVERRRAAGHAARQPLRLHLGSSSNRLPGWVNVDLLRPGRRLDLYWDLRRGLPFPGGAVDAIFAEHLFEHLTFEEGVRLIRDCRRVLRPGGVLRIGVPDLERYVQAYLGNDDLFRRVRTGRRTSAIALGEVFFRHGHRCMYDFETLALACRDAGFMQVERSAPGGGRVDPSPDSPNRAADTLYVDAINAGSTPADVAPAGPAASGRALDA